MRHRNRGRKLGRNPKHQRALLRNLAAALILTEGAGEDDDNKPKVKGRIVTTMQKAKEARPLVERCVTIARRALPQQEDARQFESSAERHSDAWRAWRESEQWRQWNQAVAPVVAARRRLLALLGSKQAVKILFDELAPRFADRPGGYTRVLRLAKPRLGDAGMPGNSGVRRHPRPRRGPLDEAHLRNDACRCDGTCRKPRPSRPADYREQDSQALAHGERVPAADSRWTLPREWRRSAATWSPGCPTLWGISTWAGWRFRCGKPATPAVTASTPRSLPCGSWAAAVTVRHGRRWSMPRLYDPAGREQLYLLNFYLPRFLDLPWREKLRTTVHELWHVSPQFDGDLRRFQAAATPIALRESDFDAQADALVEQWLAAGPPQELTIFCGTTFGRYSSGTGGWWA